MSFGIVLFSCYKSANMISPELKALELKAKFGANAAAVCDEVISSTVDISVIRYYNQVKINLI